MLNFNPAFDNTGWTVNGLTTGFTADEDNISIPPLNGFDFDFEPTTSVNVSEPYTYTVGRTATDLNPSDFDFTATLGSLSLLRRCTHPELRAHRYLRLHLDRDELN